jgi:hypothetical protein
MEKTPVYVNPYDKVHFGPSTVITLHRFGIFDPDVARRVPTLSPFSAKLTAHLRFQGIPFEPVAEQGVGNAPRGKVPFITVDGVKVADSDLVIGFLKTAFPDPDAGLSDHQRAIGHLVQPAPPFHRQLAAQRTGYVVENGNFYLPAKMTPERPPCLSAEVLLSYFRLTK